jgi:ectoine hydroxylase-related dioxygenase (phytanoyl-CoA dioxygenase family)
MSRYYDDYFSKGYAIVDDAIRPEELEQFRQFLSLTIFRQLEDTGFYSKTRHDEKFKSMLSDGYMHLDRHDHAHIERLYLTMKDSEAVGRMVFAPRILSIVKEIMQLMPVQSAYVPYHVARMDPPHDERFTYGWHQESFYSVFGAEQVQLWAPLVTASTRGMGTMSVLEGSHLLGEQDHVLERVKGGHEQKRIPDAAVPQGLKEWHAELELGQAVLFHPHLIHRSNKNSSEAVRYSLVAAYTNPYDKRFEMAPEKERIEFHRRRCVNRRRRS